MNVGGRNYKPLLNRNVVNMMEIIRCEHCGNDTIPFGTVSVDLDLKMSEWCKCCYQSKTQTQHHFFCTIGCLVEYMKKVLDGEKELKFKIYDRLTGQNTDPIDES